MVVFAKPTRRNIKWCKEHRYCSHQGNCWSHGITKHEFCVCFKGFKGSDCSIQPNMTTVGELAGAPTKGSSTMTAVGGVFGRSIINTIKDLPGNQGKRGVYTVTSVGEIPEVTVRKSAMEHLGGRSTMTTVGKGFNVEPANGSSTMNTVEVVPGGDRSTMTAVGGLPRTDRVSTINIIGGITGRSTNSAVEPMSRAPFTAGDSAGKTKTGGAGGLPTVTSISMDYSKNIEQDIVPIFFKEKLRRMQNKVHAAEVNDIIPKMQQYQQQMNMSQISVYEKNIDLKLSSYQYPISSSTGPNYEMVYFLPWFLLTIAIIGIMAVIFASFIVMMKLFGTCENEVVEPDQSLDEELDDIFFDPLELTECTTNSSLISLDTEESDENMVEEVTPLIVF